MDWLFKPLYGRLRNKSPLCKISLFAAFCAVLLVSPLSLSTSRGADPPAYHLKITLYPAKNRIAGEGKITLPDGTAGLVGTGSLNVTDMRIGGKRAGEKEGAGAVIEVRGGEALEFRYDGLFPPGKEEEVIENVGVTGSNIIDERGIMLISEWYPPFSRPCLYHLEVTLPEGFVVLSESNGVRVVEAPEKGFKTLIFDSPIPLDGITLVGGRHIHQMERYRGVSISTYFFPEEDHLSTLYRDSVKKYLDLYGEMLGRYPFGSFSVVENIFQTGYSFPTYTLLGSRILPLPYIPETSLGHEFLHQWFGHLVEVDGEQGNWSEGLTTYLADHWYKELKGEGHVYRKKILIDYVNYVPPSRDIPVSQFRGRVDFATRAIGYGKTAMIFHMVRKTLGDDDFFSSLRTFIEKNGPGRAGWDDLRSSFTEKGGRELGRLIDGWTKGTGMAQIEIAPPKIVRKDNLFHLELDIDQRSGPYLFSLPVTVETERSKEDFLVKVDGKKVTFSETFTSRPTRIIVDRDYDTFRRPTGAEIPPVISGFTGNRENIVIIPEEERERLGEVAAFFEDQGFRVAGADAVKDDMLGRVSFLYISPDRRILSKLTGFPAEIALPEAGFTVKVMKNPLNPEKVAVLFDYDDASEVKRAYKKIFRYGNYSLIAFDVGKNVAQEIEPAERGIVINIGRGHPGKGEEPGS